MKSLHKILGTIFVVILLLVVCIVLLVHLFGNSLLKTGIETAAVKTLNVGVDIGKLDFSILAGKVRFQNLVIDNPPGYEHDKLLEVADARIAVSIGSLLEETVNIKEIMLDGIDVVLEQRGLTSSNLQDIIKAIPKSKDEPKPRDQREKPAKKLHIDELRLSNINVNVKLLPLPGKADTLKIKLNPIRMTDLGTGGKMDTAKLTGEILMAITAGVAEQGAGLLPEALTGDLKAALDKTAGIGKTAVEEGRKVLEEGADAGKELIEEFKNLLKPKKK
jgi:hypothetical protein